MIKISTRPKIKYNYFFDPDNVITKIFTIK